MMFEYIAKYWSDEETSLPKPTIERGLVAGKDYGAAANRIVAYYGIKNLIELTLSATYEILNEEDVRSLYSKEDN